ncbi:hypothetical protein E2C01_096432 [Portunus trituberculatus]|uniref:Uncharacterized protein n=1 Tax=Portunus trituberculatus TaxID=210409 RepID=A0A5B7K203_PORTR|nr:hypothetical protein [Portunus trituberculatus]
MSEEEEEEVIVVLVKKNKKNHIFLQPEQEREVALEKIECKQEPAGGVFVTASHVHTFLFFSSLFPPYCPPFLRQTHQTHQDTSDRCHLDKMNSPGEAQSSLWSIVGRLNFTDLE